MPPTEIGTCDWLAEELAQARLLARPRAYQLARELRAREPFADANGFADALVRDGVLTPYQARRCLEGDARKLVLGVYDLIDPLPGGGMGTTYRAAGRADRLPYAVKVLPLRNQWNVRLVRKQVQGFAQLPPHDAVVPFVDVGTGGGCHYLVWPFVEGRTAESYVRECGPLAAPEVARLGVQLAEGLGHCHARGIVHGLLKPTNVQVGYDGQARLLDFGIGALLAENSGEEEGMVDTSSQAQVTAGMLECASPELVLDPTHLDAAGDQYSLGCVLYFCATGRYPFPGGTAMDKVVAHQKLKPEPMRTLNRNLPTLLTDVIERLMAKAPQDRYRHVEETIRDLSALAGPRPTLVPPPVPVDVRTPLPKQARARQRPTGSAPAAAGPAPAAPAVAPTAPAPRRGWLSRVLLFWRR
jgi:serine/threonine-protein kinase